MKVCVSISVGSICGVLRAIILLMVVRRTIELSWGMVRTFPASVAIGRLADLPTAFCICLLIPYQLCLVPGMILVNLVPAFGFEVQPAELVATRCTRTNLQQVFCCSSKRLHECLIDFVFLSGCLDRVRHHASPFGADFL